LLIRKAAADYIHMAGMWPNTWEIYPTLDLLVSTSRSEGMPLALLEAMASGVPVVAMGVGGVPEVVEYGTTGYVSPCADVEAAARMVVRLLHDSVRRAQMGRAARKRAEERFDLNQCVRLTTRLFEQLAGEQPSAID